MDRPLVLSHFQTDPLLAQRVAASRRVEVSPDLGLTTVSMELTAEGVRFPGGGVVDWAGIEQISRAENSCFVVEDGEVRKILAFSEELNRVYSLMPTRGAPTLLVSGIPMHRIKDTDPHADTVEKIKAIRPVVGHVLDTATGLGYTAIEAARTASHVTTIELDPVVLEIAQLNPWSQALFDNPKITQRIGSSFDVVPEFAAETFDRIVHDPPAFSLGGELYSGEFYAELYRVLRRGGILFHYIGNPESRFGETVTRGVMRRLEQAGFVRIQRRPRAFGMVAHRPQSARSFT